jgi:hypothetical protein
MRPLGKPKHRWEDNINMNLKYIGLADVDQLRTEPVDTVMHSSVKAGHFEQQNNCSMNCLYLEVGYLLFI